MSKREEIQRKIEMGMVKEIHQRVKQGMENSTEYRQAIEAEALKEAEITRKYDPNFDGKYADEYLEENHATVYDSYEDVPEELKGRHTKTTEEGKVFVYDELGTKIKEELRKTEEAKNVREVHKNIYNEAKSGVEKEHAKEIYENKSLFKKATDKIKQTIGSKQDTNQSGKGM